MRAPRACTSVLCIHAHRGHSKTQRAQRQICSEQHSRDSRNALKEPKRKPHTLLSEDGTWCAEDHEEQCTHCDHHESHGDGNACAVESAAISVTADQSELQCMSMRHQSQDCSERRLELDHVQHCINQAKLTRLVQATCKLPRCEESAPGQLIQNPGGNCHHDS